MVKPINLLCRLSFQSALYSNFYPNSIYVVAYLSGYPRYTQEILSRREKSRQLKNTQGTLSTRYESYAFRKNEMGIIAAAISHAIELWPTGNTIDRAIGITIKMQQRVWIRLRTVRHVVGDKMFEIPDSLNERGTTNKRHSMRRSDLDSRRNVERLSRPALELFGDRKYRAKI